MTQPKHYPPIGIHIRCSKIVAIDGDTVSIWFGSNRKWKVRLLSCWCPYERGNAHWRKAKETAAEFIATATKPSVFIPLADEPFDLMAEVTSLGRFLGYVYLNERDTLNKLMVTAGYASTVKGGELGT